MKKCNNYNITLFEEIRIIVYIVFFANGMFIQFFAPFRFLCDNEDYSCIFCGMRTAINYLLHFDFVSAFQSNKYIVVVLFILCLISIDVLIIVMKKIRKNKS